MARSSYSLPLGTAEDGSTACNSTFSPTSAVDEGEVSDVPLLSNLQLDDRSCEEGEGPLRAGSRTSESADRRATIDDLPDELMLEIFSHMSLSENINVLQRVSSRWKHLAQDAHLWLHTKFVVRWVRPRWFPPEDPNHWDHRTSQLILSMPIPASRLISHSPDGYGRRRYVVSEEEAIATFAAVPELRTVILEIKVSPGVFEALSRSCPRLHTLEMHRHQLLTLSEAENLFDGCREIRTLSISNAAVLSDVRLVDALARLSGLTALRLQEFFYGETWEMPLRALADSCPHVCDLRLGWFVLYRVRDAEYFISSHKSLLQRLELRWTSVEGRSIAPLLPVCAEPLRSLALVSYAKVDAEQAAEVFSALAQLHNLLKLHLHFDDFRVRHLLPAVFENGGLAKLQQLVFLGRCSDHTNTVVDEATRALAENCPELRELELWDCAGHTDALFQPLRRLRHLERLTIERCRCLGGKAMSYIAKLPALHTLEFTYINFNRLKPSVDCILEISGLQRLSFEHSECRAIPFDKFPGRLVNLRELKLERCDYDQKLLDRFRAQMPNLNVEATRANWHPSFED